MAVTGDKGEDGGETRGKNHGEQEQLRAVKAASWHPNCEFPARDETRPSNFVPDRALRPAALPPRSQPGSGLRESAVTAAAPGPGDAGRLTPTFLLGPRRGHDEGHHQVQRSQEAGGCAPRAPAAASRGLQTGHGGRGGSGGGSRCSFSGPLPHPCRPGAAALEVRRGPCRLGGGGGAGAVVRDLAAAPGGDSGSGPRARAPDVGLDPCVRVSERVSHGLRLSIAHGESKLRGRGSSSAGGHTGNGHGPRALGAGLRGAGRGPGHRPRRAVTWAARRSVCPPRSWSVRTSRPALRGPQLQGPDGTGQHKPNLSPVPHRGGGGGRPAGAQTPGLVMAAHASPRQGWRSRGDGVGRPGRAAALGRGRGFGELGGGRAAAENQGTNPCIPCTARREPSRELSAHPDLEVQRGKSIPVTPAGRTAASQPLREDPGPDSVSRWRCLRDGDLHCSSLHP